MKEEEVDIKVTLVFHVNTNGFKTKRDLLDYFTQYFRSAAQNYGTVKSTVVK